MQVRPSGGAFRAHREHRPAPVGGQGQAYDVSADLADGPRRLRSIEREFELRYGAVLYRDIGDEYVTKAHPFTADIEAFVSDTSPGAYQRLVDRVLCSPH